MFKYISEIIGRFTHRQRILALVIVLFSIILITLGQPLIKKNDCKDVYVELDNQRQELLRLNNELVNVQVEANNERIKREKEIAQILELIKSDVESCPLCEHSHAEPYRKELIEGKN